MPVYIPNSSKNRDSTQQQATANENKIMQLIRDGEFEDFLKYRNRTSIWDRVKTLGSGALDVVNRGSFAMGGAIEETYGGDPGISGREAFEATKRVGREVFSGIGGIRGDKKAIFEVIQEKVPEYGEWAKKHPYASVVSDLTLDIGLDPLTYIPAGIIAKSSGKLLSKTGKTISKVARKSKMGGETLDALGRMFIPRYGIKRGAQAFEELGYIGKGAGKIAGKTLDDAVYSERLYKYYKTADITGKELPGRSIRKAVDSYRKGGEVPGKIKTIIQSGDANPLKQIAEKLSSEEIDIVRRAVKDGLIEDLPEGLLKDISVGYQKMTRGLYGDYAEELIKAGDKPTPAMLNYMHNNALNYEGFTKSGSRVGAGFARGGYAIRKAGVEKGQIFDTFQKLKEWEKLQGFDFEKLPTVFSKNIDDAVRQNVEKIYSVRATNGLLNAGLETGVVRKLPLGTKTPFALSKSGERLLREGETIFMPKGNLRFFQQEGIKLNKQTRSLLAENELAPLFLKENELFDLIKSFPSFTTKVPVYAMPVDMAKDLHGISIRLGDAQDVANIWDKVLNVFKNTAILSPFFHNRNMVSSTAQSILADIDPTSFAHGLKALLPTTADGTMILGKTKATWYDLFKRHNIVSGSFVGQQVGKTAIPTKAGKVVEKVFKVNRWIGGHIEEHQRASLFMDGIKKGMSPLESAKRVKKFHFDYGDLTDFERKWARRVFPFYAWSRNNVPLQLEMLIKAPKKYKYLAQFKRVLAGGPESEDNPDWWKEQDVWETKFANAYHAGLPYSDLNALSGSPVGMMGPAGMIGNLARNYDPFMQKEIKEFKGQKVPIVTLGDKEFGVPPQLKYAIEGFIPVVKRYGSDLTKQISNYLSEDDELKLKAKYSIINKFIGVKLIPQLKTQREKARVYRMRDALRDYTLYRKQGAE